MTWRSDGSCRCDQCNRDVGNGGIFSAVIVADLVGDSSGTFHLCRDEADADGKVIHEGCGTRLRSTLTANPELV